MRRASALALAGLAAAGGGALAIAAGSSEDRPPAAGSRTDRWVPVQPAGLERTEVAAARIGRYVYVVGGFERRSGATVAAVERYDIRRDRWRRMRSMPVGLNHPTAVAYGGRLYVHGGYRARRNLSSATRALLRYDPRRNRWSRLPGAPTPRAAHAAGVVGGRLYVAGGASSRGSLRSMEVYDFRRRRWRRGPRMRGPARDHTAGVASRGRFYVLAGRAGGRNFRVAERYDPRRRRWERLPSMRRARGGFAAVRLSDQRIVVFGGEELGPGGQTIADVELFDPRRRRWRRLPAMRTPRHGLGGAAVGRRVLSLAGGPRPGFHFSGELELLDVR